MHDCYLIKAPPFSGPTACQPQMFFTIDKGIGAAAGRKEKEGCSGMHPDLK
jgi:hypothetical protein